MGGKQNGRHSVLLILAGVMALVLIALTAEAVMTGNRESLMDIFSLVRFGIGAMLAYVCGHHLSSRHLGGPRARQ